jgi:hypothetical protein
MNFKGKEKLIIAIIGVLLIIVLGFLISSYSTQSRYKKFYKEQLKTLKTQKESAISEHEKYIQYLLFQNDLKDIDIRNSQKKIDSLVALKNKVQIKYILKYKQIEKFNSEQIKKYWKDEFKN